MARAELEYIDCEETAIGLLCLRERTLPTEPPTVVTELTLDHEFLMSSHCTASERALATRALAMHPGRDLRVLVGGLGLGYTAREVLRSERVAAVRVVEFVPRVIEWMRDGRLPLSEALQRDPRLSVAHGDVYAELDAPRGDARHDVVLVDVDHSPDEPLGTGNAGFYTEAGLIRAKRHLAPGGVLGVWSYAEHSPFVDAMHAAFETVETETVTFENDVVGEPETNWLFFGRDPS